MRNNLKSSILVGVLSLGIATSALANGLVTMKFNNQTGQTLHLRYDVSSMPLDWQAQGQDPQQIAITPGNSSALILQKTGPNFNANYVVLSAKYYMTDMNLHWGTNSRGKTTWTTINSSANRSITCTPNAWNGQGDFTTTCTIKGTIDY